MSLQNRNSVRSPLRLRTLFAVDPSLTASGWAHFCLKSGRPLLFGVLSPPGPSVPLPHRMSWLQEAITNLLAERGCGAGDVLICEGPAPLVRNPQSALKVEGVRGVFETIARSMGMLVPGRLNPRTVQTELLGMRGRQLARAEVKEWARATAMRLYGPELARHSSGEADHDDGDGATVSRQVPPPARKIAQDIIDALLIGTVAVSRIQFAERSAVTIESAFVSTQRGGGSRNSRNTGWSERVFRRRFPSS